jgi:hypothetical protein
MITANMSIKWLALIAAKIMAQTVQMLISGNALLVRAVNPV